MAAPPLPSDTLLDPSATFVYDKYSCIAGFYEAHVAFAYITGLSGIACLLSRLHPRLAVAHAACGRVYILAMLWAMATSLLIHSACVFFGLCCVARVCVFVAGVCVVGWGGVQASGVRGATRPSWLTGPT